MAQEVSIDVELSRLIPKDEQAVRAAMLEFLSKFRPGFYGSLALRAGIQNGILGNCHIDESKAIR